MAGEQLPGGWTLDEARANHPELIGASLAWRAYEAPSESWDHDHCVFCWTGFGPGGTSAGYTDDIRQSEAGRRLPFGSGTLISSPAQTVRWVCAGCAEAYRDGFGWRTTGGPADPSRG
jgi:hypothetical protein